jgi:hypothetical protein
VSSRSGIGITLRARRLSFLANPQLQDDVLYTISPNSTPLRLNAFSSFLVNLKSQRLLSLPLVLKLGRRELTQRRVDALVDVDPMEKPSSLTASVTAIS